MNHEDVAAFGRCMGEEGVAVFPSDTVYGLACDPDSEAAVTRLYALKGRPMTQASAVMFFDRRLALAALPDVGSRTAAALERLLPGPVTLLLPNPERRFSLACGEDPATLGLRVPALAALAAALADHAWPILQSSANRAGEPEASRVEDLSSAIRDGADLILDGGELPGVASTVLDLREYERAGTWRVLRAGALGDEDLAEILAPGERPGRC